MLVAEPYDTARVCVFKRLSVGGFPLPDIENR